MKDKYQLKHTPDWKRPWQIEKFNNLSNKDERFFSILYKGLLSWLNRNIILYNKSIKHFIFNTGSSMMYIESNGYDFSQCNWSTTTGEDSIYMERPRCVVTPGNITINTEELSQPHIRGVYEREVERKGSIRTEGMNAELRRIPLSINLELNYILSNFNESIILVEELISKFVFQQYFNIVYLGQQIMCSIELPNDFSINTNKIDMTSNEPNQKIITLNVTLCTSYPKITEPSEIAVNDVIHKFVHKSILYKDNINNNVQDAFEQKENGGLTASHIITDMLDDKII